MPKKQVPIIECAGLGQIDAVEKLIKQGADVNEVNQDGDTAILIAAMRNDLPMTKILIAAGSKVQTKDQLGYSPLFWAQTNKNETMVELINANMDHKATRK